MLAQCLMHQISGECVAVRKVVIMTCVRSYVLSFVSILMGHISLTIDGYQRFGSDRYSSSNTRAFTVINAWLAPSKLRNLVFLYVQINRDETTAAADVTTASCKPT